MPHLAVKLWSERSEEQKSRAAEEIVKEVVAAVEGPRRLR